MVFAFEAIVQEDWKNALYKLGLSSLVSSYVGFLNGIHVVQIHRGDKTKGASVINNVTLNFSNGSSFTGPLAVGQNIKLSYDMASDTKKMSFGPSSKTLWGM